MGPPPAQKKRARPGGVLPEQILDRARGALIGMAVGDALGTTLEFKRLVAPAFPKLIDGPHREMTGGGPFQVKPGQVTDDTQMAVCLAQSLLVARSFNAADVFERYRQWTAIAFDIGGQTRSVFEWARENGAPLSAGKVIWLKSQKQAAGNGSLMRTAPIGVFFSRDAAARARASVEDSALTHADPRCQLSCAVLNAAIAGSIHRRDSLTPSQLIAAVSTEMNLAAAHLSRTTPEGIRDAADASAAIREDLKFAEQADPQLYGPDLHLHLTQGFVRVSFRLAFWEFVHAPDFSTALIDVVNRGGDSDTNAAITGALLGAWYGESAIPAGWREAVLQALSQSGGLFWTGYHPRFLLPLAEAAMEMCTN